MADFIKKHKRLLVILAPSLLGAIYLLLCMLGFNKSVWLDESYTAYLNKFSFSEIAKLSAADVHPPLYYFCLKLWSMLFGDNAFALRTLSALFGALAILFAFLFIKYKYGKLAALVGSCLLAASPYLIRYGQEIRMHTMAVAIAFAACYVLELAIHNKEKKWWILYAVLVALGMYTLYFSAFVWIAQLLYLYGIYKKDFFKKKVYLIYLFAALLYLPWLPFLFIQAFFVQVGGFWVAPISFEKLNAAFSEIFFFNKASDLSNWLAVLGILLLACFTYLSIKHHKQIKELLFYSLVPFFCLVLCSLPPLRSIFVPRYLLFSACTFMLILGVASCMELRKHNKSKTHKLWSYSTLLVALLCSSFGLNSVYAKKNYNFENNSNTIIGDIFQEFKEVDNHRNLPIISHDTMNFYDLSFYSDAEHPVYFVDANTDYTYGLMKPLEISNFEGGGKIKDLEDFYQKHPQFWYFSETENPEDAKPACEDCQELERFDTTNEQTGKVSSFVLYEYHKK